MNINIPPQPLRLPHPKHGRPAQATPTGYLRIKGRNSGLIITFTDDGHKADITYEQLQEMRNADEKV